LTTSTTTITWNTSNAYIVGVAGSNGTAGTNGSNGAATYVITRVANDSSAPTNAEVSGLLGRNPVAGDICTVSYNNFNNAVVYRYTTAWALFQTYITGSLIVQNTITGDKVAANTITGTNIAGTTITAANMAANSITADNAAIGNAAVNTLQIAGDAVTVPAGASNTSGVSLIIGDPQTEIVSVSLNSNGSPIYINYSLLFLGQLNGTVGGITTTMLLYNNNVIVANSRIDSAPYGGAGYSSYSSGISRGIYIASPGTGVRTFSLRMNPPLSTTNPPGTVNSCSGVTLFAIGVKR
jgi:hypothetical protein